MYFLYDMSGKTEGEKIYLDIGQKVKYDNDTEQTFD